MKLNNNMSNHDCIGKSITACIDTNRPWITYGEGNNGEPDYYRDYYEKETGIPCYMQYEPCKIEGFDNEKETVLLSNENCLIEYSLEVFEIPYSQYIADFGIDW